MTTKLCLIVGTINRYYPAEPGWRNYHLDISGRGIWDAEIQMGVQPDFVLDIADYNAVTGRFREGMFDAVRLHHVLEHIPRDRSNEGFDFTPDGINALRNIAWLLADGGGLDIEVPDFLRVARAWLVDEELDHAGVEQWVLGEHLSHHEPGDSHRALFTDPVLRRMLEVAGFTVGDREDTGLALRFVCHRAPRAS